MDQRRRDAVAVPPTTEQRVLAATADRDRAIGQCVLLALCALAASLVGCSSGGSAPNVDGAEPAARTQATPQQAPGTLIEWRSETNVLVLDRLGFAWSISWRDEQLRLTARGSDGTAGTSAVVDAGRSDRLSGLSAQPLGDGIALGHRLCLDRGCDRSRLVIERFHRLPAGVAQVGRRWSSPVQRIDAGIGSAGRVHGQVSFVSGDLVAVVAEDGEVETAPLAEEADAWVPCLNSLGLSAIRYVPSAGGDPTDRASGVPAPGTTDHRISLLLHRSTGWEPLEGSDLAYSGAPSEYPRCTANGVEQAGPGSLANRLWDGSGSWRDVTVASPPLGAQGGPVFDGLVTVRDGHVERLDTVGGAILDSVAIPADLVERALTPSPFTGELLPELGLVTVAAGRNPVVVACLLLDSTGGTRANPVSYRCDRFT